MGYFCGLHVTVSILMYSKKYNEEIVYEEDLDVGTKIDIDDTRCE